jgi:hypothetical protein
VLATEALAGATQELPNELVVGVVRRGSIRYIDGGSRVHFVVDDEVPIGRRSW